MILIADSGSTKTDWRLIDSRQAIGSYATIGFNPYYQSSEEIYDEINVNLLHNVDL